MFNPFLEKIFPELYSALNAGYTSLLRQNADGSITCPEHPDPNYFHYILERWIACTSHPAILYLYVSGCGKYRGVVVKYHEI